MKKPTFTAVLTRPEADRYKERERQIISEENRRKYAVKTAISKRNEERELESEFKEVWE